MKLFKKLKAIPTVILFIIVNYALTIWAPSVAVNQDFLAGYCVMLLIATLFEDITMI